MAKSKMKNSLLDSIGREKDKKETKIEDRFNKADDFFNDDQSEIKSKSLKRRKPDNEKLSAQIKLNLTNVEKEKIEKQSYNSSAFIRNILKKYNYI